MNSSEIRANARKSLQGKWKKAVLITLVYVLIVFVINYILSFIPFVGNVVAFIIAAPISFGILASLIKLKRDEDVSYLDFLSNGFSKFGKVWAVYGNVLLKMLVPIILVFISTFLFGFSIGGSIASLTLSSPTTSSAAFGILGIISIIVLIVSIIWSSIKSLNYSLVYYLLYDNPEMTGKEIANRSEQLMQGNRWKFFVLGLSFIGWMILSAFTFNIGLLWVFPYLTFATIIFYENLADGNVSNYNVNIEETKIENQDDDNPIKEN